jgi:5-formyltetrahydrofolate cyclo-ligase
LINLNDNKQALKKKLLLQRKNLSSFDVFIKSWFAQENLLNSIFFSKSNVLGVYYPVLNEVQTYRIIRKSLLAKKKVCLPKLQDGEIIFFSITTLNDLIAGKYNILEPLPNKNNICKDIDTVITPGIVFDKCGYRIGYGKGYYDKFLSKFSKQKISLIGLGYEFQIISEFIRYEPHDVKLDALITNKEILLT